MMQDDASKDRSGSSDEVNPKDIAPHMLCLKDNDSRPQKLFRLSYRSSAIIKAEADLEVLKERMAALKRKHALEAPRGGA